MILRRSQNAKIKDASDYIHPKSFELNIEVEKDEFYPFAIKNGFARHCLGFELIFQSLGFQTDDIEREVTKEKLVRWISLAKAEGR